MDGLTLVVSGMLAFAAVPSMATMSSGDPETITCASGTDLQRTVDQAHPGGTIRIAGTCHGPIVLTRDIIIEGTGDKATLLGDHDATTPSLTVATGTLVVVRDLVLTGTHGVDAVGGAIRNDGKLVLERVSIVGNSAHSCGAGINTGSMLLVHSVIERNHAVHRVGGLCNEGRLSLRDTAVRSNSAETIGQVESRGELTVLRSTFSDGMAGNRGESAISSQGRLTIIESSVHGHASTGGGTIVHDGDLLMRGSTVRDNHSSESTVRVSGRAQIVDSRIVDNHADQGEPGIMSGSLSVRCSAIQGTSPANWLRC